MTPERAKEVLEVALQDHEDSGSRADDLVEWFNRTDLSIDDVASLWALAHAGGFRAWDCPTCGDRVYKGDPKDWGNFQGVRQADYSSYPAGVPEQCDTCRCHQPITKAELRDLTT